MTYKKNSIWQFIDDMPSDKIKMERRGCFGSNQYRPLDTRLCLKCPWFEECGEEHEKRGKK